MRIERSVWHTQIGETKTEQSARFAAVSPELRAILLDLWNAQRCPVDGFILDRGGGFPAILDNLAKRSIRDTLKAAGVAWPGWYALRRFHGTQVRAASTLETTSRALGNSNAVADKHYVKPENVLPDVRKAQTRVSKLVN